MRTGSRAVLPLIALVSLLGAPPAAGQSAADRAMIGQFRDSLAQVGDSFALAALERRLIEAARADRNNAMQHLRLGFVSLQLGELGSRNRFDDGAGEFEWATELQPDWPWAWYGLGLAEDRVGDSQISIVQGLQAMFGKDHLTRAARAFARSVQADPSFELGLVELAATALRQRINIKTDLAREALRIAATTSAAANPDVLLYRGRVEREVGDVDSAVVAFEDYLRRGGRRGLGLLELARTQFLHGSLDGQTNYYEGAALEDSVSLALYRQDLGLIANDSSLAEFDHEQGARRVAVLRRFWSQRDRTALLRDGDRLREHYRRLYYAKRNFQLVSLKRHYDIVERYRSGSRDFDDRGIVYIRHGEPTRRAAYNAPGMQLNESWYFRRADGDLIFHFVAREDVQDYKLVESVLDVLGFGQAVALRGSRDDGPATGEANQLLLTREPFSPVYTRLLTASSAGAQKYLTEERAIGRHSIEAGTRTDSYELGYARPLPLMAGLVAVGRDSSRPLLHLTYAIPGSALHEVPSDRGHLYPVRVRLSVSDLRGAPVASLDTTRLFVSRTPVPATEHLVGRVSVPVIPGRLQYRVAVEQGSENGVILAGDTITVGEVSGDQFALSGLVLGAREANLIWRPTPADTVFFNPIARYHRTTEAELYYEVYGLPAGAPIRTQVLVTRHGGGGFLGLGSRRPTIRLTFDEHSEGPVTAARRSVSLAKLSPGRYWVEVVVSDAPGAERRSRTAFEVRD